MKQRELARLQVLNDILEYQVPTAQAAEILGVSERHTRRLLSAYRRDGAAALAHGNRGRRPPNAVLGIRGLPQWCGWPAPSTRAPITPHLTELLRERDGINLSRPHRPSHLGQGRHRQPAQPPFPSSIVCAGSECHKKECWGRLMAATTAGWGRMGPRFALLLTVDDAPAPCPQPCFCLEEDTPSYFLLMKQADQDAWNTHRHFTATGTRSSNLPAISTVYPAGPTQFARGHGGAGYPDDLRQITTSQG